MKNIQLFVATVCFAGYAPFAPGSFGTAPAFIAVWMWRPDDAVLLTVLVPLLLLGTWAAHGAEHLFGKDSGRIVIDEFCGYLVSVVFIPKSVPYLAAAFVLFRFFDILKPPPIRNIEETVSGGAGVMLDDVLAGIYTNACIQVWIYLMPF